MKLRIGSGIDFHQLVTGRDLWIGGILLQRTYDLITAEGYQIVNIDATLCLEAPKIKPYVIAMQECIASILHIGNKDISIKATTTETMGFTGREEGLVATATCLLMAKS